MIALVTLAPEPSVVVVVLIYAVAAVCAALAVAAFSIVVHQVVTYGIGPIRWLRPIWHIRVRLHLWRENRQQVAVVEQDARRRALNAVAGVRR